MKRLLYHSFRIFYLLQNWRRRRFTDSGTIALIALASSAVVGLDTNKTMAYQVFAFLLSLFIIAMIFSLFFRARFSGDRILPKFGTAGEPFEYRIVIQNLSPKIQNGLFLFENLEDPRPTFEEFLHTPEPDEERRNLFDQAVGFYRWQWLIFRKQGPRIKSQPIPALMPNEKGIVKIDMLPLNRGYLRFKSITICRPDPFGLFYAFITIPAPKSLMILPKQYTLPQIHLPGSRQYQSGGVALTSSIGESEEFISLRDYRPGDSLRRIHWKSWAKIGKPVVKEFQDEFFVRHALILDTFENPYGHNPLKNKEQNRFLHYEIFEEAVSVAASFVCSIQTQESLLDLIFVGPEAYCFTAGRGLAHTDKILEILASVRICREKPFSLLPPVVTERAAILSGCICILLSWDEDRKNFIRQLRELNVPVLVLVVTDSSEPVLNPGPMADKPQHFHQIELGKIQEGLSKL